MKDGWSDRRTDKRADIEDEIMKIGDENVRYPTQPHDI